MILAGGVGTRLKKEKYLLEFEGKPIICSTVEKLLQIADEVVVVGRSEKHARTLAELIPQADIAWDCIKDFGPVAGLEASMRKAKGRFVFATGCDLPFLNIEVIERLFLLMDEGNGYDAAVPTRPNGFFEPLHSVYNREKMLNSCEKALKKGEHRIHVPLQELEVCSVPIDSLRSLDPMLLTFFNVNTPDDLVRAKEIWVLQKEFFCKN